MKGLVIVLVVVLSNYKTSAQYFETHNLYASGGLLVGNYLGVAGSLNYMSHEKYSIQLSYSSIVNKPKSQPTDYNPPFLSFLTLGLYQPKDQLNSFELLIGRVIVVHKTGKIRLNLRGGLIYSTLIKPVNWQKTPYTQDYGNYTYEFESHKKLGVIFKPEIEFPVFRFYGWGIAPFILMNNESVLWGVELNSLFGLLRKSSGSKILNQTQK